MAKVSIVLLQLSAELPIKECWLKTTSEGFL